MTTLLRRRLGSTSLLLIGSLIGGSTIHAATDVTGAARASAAKFQKAVVTLRLVVEMKMNMRGQTQTDEQKVESTGFVIDPNGLTVADASSLDVGSLLKSLLGGMGGASGLGLDSKIKETAILLDDGTELPADVVLTDADLGLAFVRPRDTTRKFDALVLKERSAQPQLLDEIIVLGRHGELGNRAPTLSIDSIRSIVKGPRPFYTSDRSDNTGCLAFAADGEVLGLYVAKAKQGGDAGRSPLGMLANRGGNNMLMVVIRPVNDILEIAAQARQAAPSVPDGSGTGAAPASGP